MNNRRFILALVLTVFSAAVGAKEDFHGLRVEPPKLIRSHRLVGTDGAERVFPLATGNWQLVFFGYTHCPDICPMTLHKTSILMKALGADGRQLTPVFISIDSQRDQPQALGEYVNRFEVPAVGLSGEPEALTAVANEFGVLMRRFQGKTALAYTLTHSSFLYLLDPQGRVRMLYPGSAEIDGIARDVRRLALPDQAAR